MIASKKVTRFTVVQFIKSKILSTNITMNDNDSRIESNQFEFESVRIKLYIRISSNRIESNQSTIRIRFEFDLNETNQKLSDSIRIGSNFIDSFGTLTFIESLQIIFMR